MQVQIMKTSIPPRHRQMNSLEMVDAELNVVSILVYDIPEWTKEAFLRDMPYDDINALTFYYHPGADVVVLNRSHNAYELYKLLAITYLNTSDCNRKLIRKEIPKESIGTAFDLFDYIISKRLEHGRTEMRDTGNTH